MKQGWRGDRPDAGLEMFSQGERELEALMYNTALPRELK
jgi:hypothetical protein